MDKQNCCEFIKCGREPGGAKVAELCVCKAAIDSFVNGLNKGKKWGQNLLGYCRSAFFRCYSNSSLTFLNKY